MADTTKAQKLASARKKFKELKKEKKKTSSSPQSDLNPESAPISREHTPIENITNTSIIETTQPNYANNYFNGAAQHENSLQAQPPAAFFDSFATNVTSTPANTYFTDLAAQNLLQTANYFNKTELVASPDLLLPETIEKEHISTEIPENEPCISNIGSIAPPEPCFNDQPTPDPIVESLKQFLQNTEPIDPNLERLTKKIQTLEDALNHEKSVSAQLFQALDNSKLRTAQLEAELASKEALHLQTGASSELELSHLRDELRCHAQAMQIHVAEKAELLATLTDLQRNLKGKTEDCEELSARLKTSRSRAADLERELNAHKSEKLRNDSNERETSAELEQIRREHRQLMDEKEEIVADMLESREKLRKSAETTAELEQQVAGLKGQLAMADIKLQQLNIGESGEKSQFDAWMEEKSAFEAEIRGLNDAIKALAKDRDEAGVQYQQYVQQLNSQMANLAERVETLQKENETLAVQEQNRIRHIGELEKQLQNVRNEQLGVSFTSKTNGAKIELENALDLVEKLEKEVSELKEANLQIESDKDDVLKELAGKCEIVEELEGLVADLRGNRPDSVKLLAKMESDQIAASRAVEQNLELKRQMDSMQEVFVKLNNDKVDLTEKMVKEQQNSKDVLEKLQKTEIHLQTLATAIEVKDKELTHLRDSAVELNKQILQSEQLTDRLRHYEAHDHGSPSLQTELQDAHHQIHQLNHQVRHLTEQLSRPKEAEIAFSGEANSPESNVDTNHNDNVLDKEAAMAHLEQKFMRTMKEVADLTEEKQRLEHLVLQLQSETETIGEYVALYQHQRSVLKQRAAEKDQQLTQLASDREKIKGKLDALNELIGKLVAEQGVVPSELLAHHEQMQSDGLCEEHARLHSDLNELALKGSGEVGTTGTAEKIIALLSEIKSSNLVQPVGSIHHCAWCSGQLITV